ncbi:MAG TPA: ABC transporter substrate-binding protein [Roseomonas sp.]|jgi:peptide/nickel transport system substrate-binding protein
MTPPFTARAVAFSAQRACCLPGQPFSLRTYIPGKTFTVVDKHTARVSTTVPAAILNDMLPSCMISVGIGAHTAAEYNVGSGSPGTGPYRGVEHVPGDRFVLAANPNWWARRPG